MRTIHFTDIQAAAEVSLHQHAVIEASAGTGKTYTLIELVMRLLLEERMQIEKLLLVTFTEQATGELKARIRERLQDELRRATDVALIAHLEHNILQLNQASVFTIHGFCHGALREFAFEQGAVFEAEVISDYDVWNLTLRQMKRQWPANQQLLKQLQAYTADKKITSIDDLLLQLAAQFKPEFDTIYPNSTALNVQDIIIDIRGLLGLSLAEYEAQFVALKGLKKTSHKTLWLGVIEPFITALQAAVDAEDSDALMQLLASTYTNKKDLNEVFFKGCPAIYKVDHKDAFAGVNLQSSAQLFELITGLNEVWESIQSHQQGLKYSAIPELLNELVQRSQHYKLDRGLLSYDDMIVRLWQQLRQEGGLPQADQLLSRALRDKYQVAIIDEFQDTDIRQWQIFEQLFLKASGSQSNGPDHRLWVIGDPKQAIYGFRGADLHTYEAAKTSIIESYQGNAYRLGTNYRTVSGLITELNRFFADAESGWFQPEAVHVKAPDSTLIEINKQPQIVDNKGLSYFNCLSVEQSDADTVKRQLAEKIVATIKHQIINQVEVKLKGEQRKLNAADVCILVRGNKDAEYIEAALQQQHIPFTFHKKKNLYQSIEAIHFHVVLTALARPNEIKRVNNALLTLFFGLQPMQLADFAAEQLPATTELWLSTKEAVLAKDWVKVFDLLLNESGALFRARNNSRRLANIKQLKQQLLKAALQNNLGADALLKFFQQKRQQTSNDEDLHHKDTERNAVKIMTMHISKGLEFPVVFLFGGFGQGPGDAFLQFYDEQRQGMVYDLVKQHQLAYESQQLKEAHQLYYVAMTRAIFMLFLPYVDQSENTITRPGWYVKTVMQRLNETGMHQQIPAESSDQVVHIDSSQGPVAAVTYDLKPPRNLYSRRRNLNSFSSLSQLKKQSSSTAIAADFSQSLTAELISTEDRIRPDSSALSSPQIPGGVKTGHVLHGIFEHVDFKQISVHESAAAVYQDAEIMAVIDQQMQQFKLDNKAFADTVNKGAMELNAEKKQPLDYRQQFADWAWHTLNKPLAALNGQCLAGISAADRCHELSFFWNHGTTHLTGFIDLLFAVPGNDGATDYYILDWKSNYSANGYSPAVLSDEVMTQHQYHWQYQLYALAVQSWFDALNLKNARLKGAIYVFSRGINCHEAVQNGVFYDDFSDHSWQLADIKTELLQIDQFGVKS